MRFRRFLGPLCLACLAAPMVFAQDAPPAADPSGQEVFSGPQEGEPLGAVKIRRVLGEAAGSEMDVMEAAGDDPVLLIFVNEFTRPSVGLVRTLMKYAESQKSLHAAVVFLTNDATEMTERLRRAQHALPVSQVLGLSTDGPEGPGSYGLNRNVAVTVLVGKDRKATANFALIQPSLQADAVRIAEAVHRVAGGDGPAPTLRSLGVAATAGERDMRDAELTNLLRSLIQKTNTPEQTARAADAIESYVKDKPALQRQIRDIVGRINQAGKMDEYGTPEARKYLKQWLK